MHKHRPEHYYPRRYIPKLLKWAWEEREPYFLKLAWRVLVK